MKRDLKACGEGPEGFDGAKGFLGRLGGLFRLVSKGSYHDTCQSYTNTISKQKESSKYRTGKGGPSGLAWMGLKVFHALMYLD